MNHMKIQLSSKVQQVLDRYFKSGLITLTEMVRQLDAQGITVTRMTDTKVWLNFDSIKLSIHHQVCIHLEET